jgi:FkbM family methyltransferase
MPQVTNAEKIFYNSIKTSCTIIFDVGCRNDSEFINEADKEVHYFDPVFDYIKQLEIRNNKNTKAVFNRFGLSDKTEILKYRTAYESFQDRGNTLGDYGRPNWPILDLQVKKGIDYVLLNNIERIDFLKIDTEGFEYKVLKGFDSFLNNIKIIQFEYGGTWLDANVTLLEVINYLIEYNFYNFNYITDHGLVNIPESDYIPKRLPITELNTNIVCFNQSFIK